MDRCSSGQRYVLIDETLIPEGQACLPVTDRGFLFGDAIYETLRSYNGRPFLVEEHFERLRSSADAIYLQLPWSDADLRERLERLLTANSLNESRIRITVTRGDGDMRACTPEELGPPRLVITARPFQPVAPILYQQGVKVEIADRVRNHPAALDPAIKSGNLLNNVLARLEKRDPESFEVLLPNHLGNIAEGTHTNIFLVDAAGRLHTPSLASGLLPGITRALILQLAERDNVEVVEGEMSAIDLFGAREVFITASTIEILPVSRVDDHVPKMATPGEITRRLSSMYRRSVESYCGTR
ncbi:MAG: hypothetical protein GY835_15040 [bacterium]|nr:hypothetical protein [bacterium]